MVEVVPSDESGELDVTALEDMLKAGRVKAVAITHVPTNGGVINPAKEGVAMCVLGLFFTENRKIIRVFRIYGYVKVRVPRELRSKGVLHYCQLDGPEQGRAPSMIIYVTVIVLDALAFREKIKLLGRNSLEPMSTSCNVIHVRGPCTI